jgi:hypothetical protein
MYTWRFTYNVEFYYDYFIVTYFTNFATSTKLHFISSKISKSTSQNPFINCLTLLKLYVMYIIYLFIYVVPYNKRTYNRHSSYDPAPGWCAHCIIVVLVGWISGECPHRLRGWFESWKKSWFRHGRTVVCVLLRCSIQKVRVINSRVRAKTGGLEF